MYKPDGQSLFLGSVIAAVLGFAVYFAVSHSNGQSGGPRRLNFNGARAYQQLQHLCSIGSRTSGTPGMTQQQKELEEHFTRLGARVTRQNLPPIRHPERPTEAVQITNLIVEWHPERRDRILIAAHYDTRPFPDNDPDPRRRKSLFVGANDGASGVALLCELGTLMPNLQSVYGVDFVFFDGEELVYDRDRDKYFLGSTYFAQDYAANPPPHRYHWGVLLDMVADRELQLYFEENSLKYAKPLVFDIWKTAGRLGVNEFKAQPRHTVDDDHIPLNKIAKIPTCDVIDFDYPRPGRVNYWHTTLDTPEQCSAESLTKVGSVLYEWLRNVEKTLPPKGRK